MENNKNIKGKNVLSKKGLLKSGLAVTVLGTTVAGPFMTANAAEDANAKTDDNKTSDNTSAKMKVNVDDSKINKAVEDAKKAGVKLDKESDKTKTVPVKDIDKAQKEIQDDYEKQIKELEEATKKAKAGDNSDDLKAYEEKVKREKDAIDKAKSNPSQPKYSEGAGNKFSKSGSWTNLKSKTLDNDVHLASSGNINSLDDLTNGNFKIHAYSDKKGKIKNSNIVQKISWGNTAPKGKGIVKGDKITEDAQKKVPGYNESLYDTSGKNNPRGKTTQLHSVKAGTWVTIPKAVQLADGSKKDLKVKFTKSGTNLDYGEDWVTFWNEGGAINYYDGSHDINNTPPKDKIKATYQVDDGSNGKNKYLWTGVVLDIDAGQELTIDSKTRAILGMGGGLKANGDDINTIKSDDNLGKTWGKNKSSNFLDGTKSVPDGTVVFADYAGEISHTLANTGIPTSTLVANGDFGLGVKTSVAEAPEKPKDVNAKYHLNKLEATPSNHKDVEKGIQKEDTKDSIDKQKVNVGDEITYPLTNSDLPANRTDDIKSYVMKDDLPKGVEPDKEAMEKNIDKSKWEVKIDGQNVTITAKKELLDEMNKDKKKAFKVPDVGLVAKVVGGNTNPLDNTFDTIINDNTVKSNKVTNNPPPIVKKAAHKTVSTDKIINFDEGYEYGLDFTVPNDKSYKKVQFKDHDMTNGSLDFEDVKVYADIPESDSNKSDDTKADDTKSDNDKTDNKTNDSKSEDSTRAEDEKDGSENISAKNGFGSEQQAEETKSENTKSDDSKSENNKSEESKGQDVTKEGKLEFDKEKDTFTWTANDPSKFLGKKVHIDVKAKVKDGKTLDKYKTDQKDKNGNTIYSLPNIGHMVLDGEDTPTNKVPIRVVKSEPSIKKYIVEDNNLLEKNKGKEGEKLTYQLDAQFGSGKPKSISDQLDKEKLDLNDVKIYEDNSKSDNSTKSEKDNSNIDESKDKESKVKTENQVDKTKSEDKSLKTGKYSVNKDIDAGKYSVKNNDASDALIVTKDSDGKTVTNEIIKPGETKNIELKDKEELSVTAGDKDVTFTSENAKSDDSTSDDAKSDDSTSDDTKSDDTKSDDAKSDDSTSDDTKSDDAKSDDTKSDDAKSDDTKSDDTKSDDTKSDDTKSDDTKSDDSTSDDTSKLSTDSKGKAFDTKNAKDITKEGKLELNKDNESFTWTPNDPSKFNNKKVKVVIDSTIKKDLKYENGKAQIENVANLQDGDKKLKSNKVLTELEKKDPPKETPKENPKDPEQPQKEQPQKEQPQKGGSPAKQSPLPSTGSQTADAILYGAAGLLGITGLYYGIRKFRNRNN